MSSHPVIPEGRKLIITLGSVAAMVRPELSGFDVAYQLLAELEVLGRLAVSGGPDYTEAVKACRLNVAALGRELRSGTARIGGEDLADETREPNESVEPEPVTDDPVLEGTALELVVAQVFREGA